MWKKWEQEKKIQVDSRKPNPEKDGNGRRRKWEKRREREDI